MAGRQGSERQDESRSHPGTLTGVARQMKFLAAIGSFITHEGMRSHQNLACLRAVGLVPE